jgi:TolB-like protein/tetratricopeptide (TPR) repeat protein
MAVHKVFRFEGYTLDVTRGCLSNADREIDLRPKSFDVLCYLVENAGRLVSKDEIIKTVWPNVFVTDDSIKQCVSELRIALCDGEQRMIKTVPRRGYLFAAPIAEPSGPVEGPPSIAVLPFTNMGGDPQQDYFSDGISEDLITSLSKFASLFVIAQHSAFKYKGTHLDVKQIGRELGVRYLLVGSVRRDADRVRITAQLVDTSASKHLWAEHYDRELTGIFAVQDEVTQKIVVTLVAHVTKSELDRALRKPPENLAAYDRCLRANAIMKNHQRDASGETIAAARTLYEQSLAADPRYAPALQGLAHTCVVSWLHRKQYEPISREYQEQSTIDRALCLAQRAVELDGNLPDAHVTLAYVLHWQYRRAEGMAEFERAFELNPNLADFRFSIALIHNGRAAEAIEDMRRIMRLDPFHPDVYFSSLGYAYYLGGLHAEALENLRTGARRMPDWRPAHVWLATAAAGSGRDEEARRAAGEVLRLEPGFTIAKWLRLERLARQEDADRVAEDLRKAGLPE